MTDPTCSCPLKTQFDVLKAQVASSGNVTKALTASDANLKSFMTLFSKGTANNTIMSRAPFSSCRQVENIQANIASISSTMLTVGSNLKDALTALNAIAADYSALCGPYANIKNHIETAIKNINSYIESAIAAYDIIVSHLAYCNGYGNGNCGNAKNVSYIINTISPFAKKMALINQSINDAINFYYSKCQSTPAPTPSGGNKKCPQAKIFDEWRALITVASGSTDAPIIATGKQLLSLRYDVPTVMQGGCCANPSPGSCPSCASSQPLPTKEYKDPPPAGNCAPGTCPTCADLSSLSSSLTPIKTAYTSYFTTVQTGIDTIEKDPTDFPYINVEEELSSLETMISKAQTGFTTIETAFSSSAYFADTFDNLPSMLSPFDDFFNELVKILALYDADCAKSSTKQEPPKH